MRVHLRARWRRLVKMFLLDWINCTRIHPMTPWPLVFSETAEGRIYVR